MKYMLILVGTEGEQQGERTPEELQAVMDPWNRFTKEVVEAGAFVAGEGLYPSSAATTLHHRTGGERIVTDGPFAETKEQVGGFYLLECKDLDEAIEWARKVPIGEGSSVEIRPVMDFSDFGLEDPYVASRAAR